MEWIQIDSTVIKAHKHAAGAPLKTRTLMIAAGVPYAESALLLGQRLPGASGGYVYSAHLVEALRPHVKALEDLLLGYK